MVFSDDEEKSVQYINIDDEDDNSFFSSGGKKKTPEKKTPEIIITTSAPVSSPRASEASDADAEDHPSDETASEADTVMMLSRDPLFLVLSKYLANERGNIVDVLERINANLEALLNKKP